MTPEEYSGLLIASNNQGKIREIEALLSDLEVNLLTPRALGINLSVAENGDTYYQNALIKARAYAHAARIPTLADDSGLEVEALAGLPGIRSARFAMKSDASDADRRSYLLSRLQGLPQPWMAIFRSVVVWTTPQGDLFTAEGTVSGVIIKEERGERGFGYDPIFLIPERGLTMAELSLEDKNRLSHRAGAIRKLKPYLLEHYRQADPK